MPSSLKRGRTAISCASSWATSCSGSWTSSSRTGGKTVAVGLAGSDVHVRLPQNRLVADERTLIGSYMGSSVPLRDVPRYIELWQRGRLPVERLVSGTFRLDEINGALDELVAGEVTRTVCRFPDGGDETVRRVDRV